MRTILLRIKRTLLSLYLHIKTFSTTKNFNYKEIPIIIINFNQLFYLKQMVDFLQNRGFKKIVIIDNNSTYPPLLEYYNNIQSHVTIHRLDTNEGHMVFWKRQDLFHTYIQNYYVITDPDIILNPKLPRNFLRYFKVILDRYPQQTKVGMALRIDDIPDSFPPKKKVVKWEKQFWKNRLTNNIYIAGIDTTFALYRPLYTDGKGFITGMRVAGNFTAGHGGWYINPKALTEEQLFYIETANKSASWKIGQDGALKNQDYIEHYS